MSSERRHRQQEPQRWEPTDFRPETTTVWSFPERGSWAIHSGAYRGNWSPYVPRNLILRYTEPGDWVLDPFVGGGTTAIEAALLGRRAIAGDLSAAAVLATKDQLERLQQRRFPGETPALLREDARALAITDQSMQLVLLHPPYADAIRYSADTAGDLSHLAAGPFLAQLRHVAAESLRVLAPRGRCALLIGDLRRQGHVVPLGFAAIQACRREGLVLEDLIIKRQHHTRMEGSWSGISAQRRFLLLAHEYLAVLRRNGDPPPASAPTGRIADDRDVQRRRQPGDGPIETGATTVWAVADGRMEADLPELARQAFERRNDPDSVLFVRTPETLAHEGSGSTDMLPTWLHQVTRRVQPGGVLAVETRDVRTDGTLHPMGLE
ncbi:MAG TPA: DNA methyltransferase, partial [Chloroflexota bacterium]